MALDIHQAVRKACLWLPEAEEVLSHGSPSFRVRGKGFAHYVVNHHGDGRVALWLNVLPGAQQLHVAAQPKHFFVPPYVGPSGWLGVLLDRGLSWNKIAGLVREAYEKVAPADLRRQLPKTPLMQTPTKALAPSDIDPFKSRRALTVWKQVGKIAAALPDTRESTQFGSPSWLVGKKTFLIARHQQGKLTLCFWVGVDQQGLLIADARFEIPPYMGHNGWIALDVSKHHDAAEITALARQSYRHFASKRLLKSIGEL